MFIKKIFILTFFISYLFNPIKSQFSLDTLTERDPSVSIPFVGTIEAKKKQLEDLEKRLSETDKRKKESNTQTSQILKKIDSEIDETKKDFSSTMQDPEKDSLNKIISILNDRKQNLINYNELWQQTIDIIKKNIKQITEIISHQENKQEREEDKKPAFSWKELQKAQKEIYELISKINSEKSYLENLKKQKINEKENLYSLQKQKVTKSAENEEISNKIKNSSEKQNSQDSRKTLKLKAEIIREDIKLLKEKIEFSKLTSEKLDLEIQYKENEIEYKESLLNGLKDELENIKNLLILEEDDVRTARSESQSQAQKTMQIKEELNKKRDLIKLDRDKNQTNLESLKIELKGLKEAEEEQRDNVKILLLETEIQKQKSIIALIKSELYLIDEKKEQADLATNLKEINTDILDIRYKLSKKDIDLREKINEFKNQREIALNYKKNLHQQEEEAIKVLKEINKNIENIKSKDQDIKDKKNSVFKVDSQSYQKALDNLQQTNKNLNKQLKSVQEFITINEEILIKQQNEILNQYNFIIKDLEEKQIISNIWERSPRAISLNDLQKALLDAETFFRNIFWDTNKYLSPTILAHNIKEFQVSNYLWLLIFFSFFFVSLFSLKLIFLLAKKEIQKISQSHPSSFLYLIQTFIEFALKHLKLFWWYLFIIIHITFDFGYIFSTISPIVNSYFLATFHLISIPILIYLSKELLIKLKSLNEKLGYSLFTEKFQNQFIFLSSIALFSSSILLPLRKAFLSYSAEATEFPDVLIAAYILILVLVLLFAVNKQDVLKLIPDNKFLIWIKKQIDKHYYPVFIFFMGLLVISNPYIGYSNLAWYLAFVVPLSLTVVYGVFVIHSYLRKYSLYFFLSEEGEELHDKFEYAKAYYGFFIITGFLFISFFAFFFLSRIWNLNYMPEDLWRMISEDWVIITKDGNKLGIVQFITLVTFIIFGFLISSLTNKFILNKLYDVFRTEPGTQNTLSRITHYLIITVVMILGFAAIHFEGFILYVGGLLLLGAGFGLKDLITDFIAGFFVLIERPVEIGHFIQTDEIMGTVHRISPRATTIRTARNFSVIIPNKDLMNKPIINWGQGRFAVGFEIIVIASYGSDPAKVKEILLDTIQKNPTILKVPAITVRLEDFLENGIQFFIRAFVSARKVRDQWDIASDLRFKIIQAFRENNIKIALPQSVIHFSENEDKFLKNGKFVKAIDIKFDEKIEKTK